MSQDMMKNEFDNATYANNEFQELQVQLYDMSRQTFNGVSLFAEFANGGSAGVLHAIRPMHPAGLITQFQSS